MADRAIISKLADIPLAQPGFDNFGMSAPVIVQMNTQGRWENSKPDNLDEDQFKAIINHLAKSNALSAAQSYCCQCAAENKTGKGLHPQYVPVVMMPIYPSDKCPFDMECEVQKIRDSEKIKSTKTKKPSAQAAETKEEDKIATNFPKKRGYVMQRLTDFDLLSQW